MRIATVFRTASGRVSGYEWDAGFVSLRTNTAGTVGWMSDWSLAGKLVRQGVLEQVYTGEGAARRPELVLTGEPRQRVENGGE